MSNQPICDFLKLNKMVFLSFIILCIISSSYVSFQMKKKKKKKKKKKQKKRLKWRNIIMFEAL